jgi:hypothetical protein
MTYRRVVLVTNLVLLFGATLNMRAERSFFGEDPETVWFIAVLVTLGIIRVHDSVWRRDLERNAAANRAFARKAAEAEAAERTARELEFERTVVRDPIAEAKFRRDIGLPPNKSLERSRDP